MAAFRFRAAAALELRQRAEDSATRALGDARAALERAERSLADGEAGAVRRGRRGSHAAALGAS